MVTLKKSFRGDARPTAVIGVTGKIAAIVMASAMASSMAAADDGFQLSEKLSVTGFIDMSWSMSDPDGADSTSSAGLDQFEIDFLYDVGQGLSAQVDLEYQDNGSGEEVDVEQAFFNYQVSDQWNVKAGRFLSYSGWETEEPTGLFQYSGAGYAKYFYGGYQQGLSANYSGMHVGFAASVVNALGDLEGEDRDSEQPGYELMAAFMPTESVTLKAFYLTDELDGTDETTKMVNVWGSFASGPLTLAAEYNTSENTAAAVGLSGLDSEASGYLLMANYAFEAFAVTLRYHDWEVENAAGTTTEEISGFTFAPSFSLTDNLLIVLEYRIDEDGLTDMDTNSYAIEALFTY